MHNRHAAARLANFGILGEFFVSVGCAGLTASTTHQACLHEAHGEHGISWSQESAV